MRYLMPYLLLFFFYRKFARANRLPKRTTKLPGKLTSNGKLYKRRIDER